MLTPGPCADRDVVVVVDDEPTILRAIQRSLHGSFDVLAYGGAEEALERVRSGGVSVVLSDIAMPGMSGLELLGVTRELDPDLPVVLITGSPSVESATQAIEHGVFRYLPKPCEEAQLASVVNQASQFRRLALLKREALELRGAQSTQRRVALLDNFQHALASLTVAFQPIVSVSQRKVFGYEALMRSTNASFRLPAHLLEAAEQVDGLDALGRAVRARAVEGLTRAPAGTLLFVNLHPRDLADPELTARSSPLTAVADRVVLEITERASLSGITDLAGRVDALRRLGFRIAIDDLGAGYAGLTSFAQLEPEIVKLDMSLTRGVDRSMVKQKLISSFSALCRELGMTIVVEGVETAQERDALVSLGCDLLQGHLFGRPSFPPPAPEWCD
jgi:EAL domain-containing protein (putative c-di-GMP-specific phosphodiesterase class I)